MSLLSWLIPGWLLFEVAQIVACENFLRDGTDPRVRGPREGVAFVWSVLLLLYGVWMCVMVFRAGTHVQVAALLAVTVVGFVVRRAIDLKRVLMVLRFEGAVRIGLLVSLLAVR